MWSWLSDPNLQWVLMGSLLLGISAGAIGSFALLRGRSLLGDVLAHAALPGICLAFILTQNKGLLPLMIGAAVAGLIATKCIDFITEYSRIKEDTALGIVLTVFFGVGIVLLTAIQHSGAGNQAGLDAFLFGQAAAMIGRDVWVMSIVAAALLVFSALFFKEFKLVCFDRSFAGGVGFPVRVIDTVLMALIVMAVVVGLQAVGVILMAALLITPAVAARYWTDRLGLMVALAGIFGGASGVIGSLTSALGPRLPTGPLIVLAATVLFLLSMFAAPSRGLCAKWRRAARLREKVQRENFLRDIYERYELALPVQQVATEDLLAPGVPLTNSGPGSDERSHVRSKRVPRIARRLERQGLIRIHEHEEMSYCALTLDGLRAAWDIAHKHRLWEIFLMHEAELRSDHVDRDADDIEHFLTPDLVASLEQLLKVHQREPKLLPSVHPLKTGGMDSWTHTR